MARPEKPIWQFPVLTSAQETTALEIKELRKKIRDLQHDLNRSVNDCQHVWAPTRGYEWCAWRKEWHIEGSARCMICAEFAQGWFCPTSPNLACDYDWKNDPAGDSCIYCGGPEERK